MLFTSFGLYEYWESQVIGDKGHKDLWQGLVGLFGGSVAIFALKLIGII